MEGDCVMKSSKLDEDSDHDSLKENRPPNYQRTKKSKQVCIWLRGCHQELICQEELWGGTIIQRVECRKIWSGTVFLAILFGALALHVMFWSCTRGMLFIMEYAKFSSYSKFFNEVGVHHVEARLSRTSNVLKIVCSIKFSVGVPKCPYMCMSKDQSQCDCYSSTPLQCRLLVKLHFPEYWPKGILKNWIQTDRCINGLVFRIFTHKV